MFVTDSGKSWNEDLIIAIILIIVSIISPRWALGGRRKWQLLRRTGWSCRCTRTLPEHCDCQSYHDPYQNDLDDHHLELLLLGMKLPTAGDAPQHVEHQNLKTMTVIMIMTINNMIMFMSFYIYLVAESQWFAFFLGELPLQVVNLEINKWKPWDL